MCNEIVLWRYMLNNIYNKKMYRNIFIDKKKKSNWQM
jgi:hypothetical protein